MPGQSWEILSDASCCGQLGAWAQQQRFPELPCCPPLLTVGEIWHTLAHTSGHPAPRSGHVVGDYFTAAPPGIKYSCPK